MPGNGNSGGGSVGWGAGFGGGLGVVTGEGGRQPGKPAVSTGEGGTQGLGGAWDLGVKKPPGPVEAAPRVPVIREARNVQRANIDRSSFHDPSVATLDMGAEYLSSRNATNPRPQGDTGVGAVGYDFTPSNERLY